MRARAGWPGALVALASALLGCRGTPAPDELAFPLALEFAGAERVPAEELEEVVRTELARLEVAELDKAAVDDAAFALEVFYRARGHAEAYVDYEYVPEAEPPLARFRIEEGPLVRVRALDIEGATALLADVRAILAPFAPGGIYDAQGFEAALDELGAAYRARGFLGFALEADEPVLAPESATVDLRVVLHEGPQFVVRAFEVQGGLPALARDEAALAARYVGAPYVAAVAHELENALIAAYRRRGHPDVVVEVAADSDEASGDTRLVARVVPGERVTIAGFRFEGNERTRATAILGLLRLETGDVYAADEVRAAFRELYATGLFESVVLELEGDGPARTLVVRVVEARSLLIRIEPGYGSYEGPRILLGVEEKNFLGRAQVVQLEGTASALAQSARLSFIDRDFLGSRFTSETTLFAEQREEPSFSFVRRGFNFFLRRVWNEDWSSSAGYEFRPTNVTDEDFATPLPPDFEEDSHVAALSVSVTFDDRDSLLLPTRGQLARARVEYADDAIGSDTEFVRGQLEYARLLRLGEQGVLAASLRTGVIAPFGVTNDIPLAERFFNGGESSVRSFTEDELLPAGATGEPRGGEAATTFNLEYRRTVWGNLGGALFFDAGNVTAELADYTRFDGIRTAIGAGLRYLLPIGPVRLDAGWNPNAREDEDDIVVHFSVGFPF